MSVATFMRHILTEPDNATACPVRVGWLVTLVTYHIAAAWMVIGQHLAIDIAALGQYIQHMSTLNAAGALSVGAKALMKADAPNPPAS